jgi:hypothetical protein
MAPGPDLRDSVSPNPTRVFTNASSLTVVGVRWFDMKPERRELFELTGWPSSPAMMDRLDWARDGRFSALVHDLGVCDGIVAR